ncbi:unnamed protein product [Fusarium graminearum]|uniref:Chromosome 2, complete genome n=1 Tax=Gibberella zeae (strain ATCC MYA-4620 / CBS 123657 / FGSC 9075 / NRRL 31084 / PH-1) TaxID=229533 RepID=A0A1C3YM01_GIBZE|nr:unnamed protein product [Fusarium graminearum]
MISSLSSRLPRLPACQACAQKKTKCDNGRPSCSSCERTGLECLMVTSDADVSTQLSRAMIDELERKEQALSQRLRELEASSAAHDPGKADTLSPDDRHTRNSIAASSPATREGASISFIAHLFSDANWRKSHASLLRTLADAPGVGEVSIAPCALPSAAETQMLFEKYLSWAHIQNPFLLRRSIWALHQRLLNNQDASAPVANHDLFRAFMLCAIGSVLPYRNRIHDRHPGAYYNAALQYLGTEFLTRGLDSVQDLLLICRFGIYHPIGTSVWDVVRVCGRLCIELGLHNNPNVQGDLLQTQLRRRIFWQFYLIDRYSSTTLDRPFLIDDNDISTKFPVETSDEELEAANNQVQCLDSFGINHEPNVQNEMTVFFVSVKLRQVSSHIQTEFSKLRRKVIDSPSKRLLPGHIHVAMTKLLQELQDWRNNCPIIQEPSCLYETQEWYDLLLARERQSVLRRAIDLVPKVNGSPPKGILTVFLRSSLETIDRYHSLWCMKRTMMTHTRSYFHMLFTAGLSVMYCTSVSKTIAADDLRASYQGLLRCRELLNSVTKQLPDANNYVSVYEALFRDVSQRLWPKESETSLPSDASLVAPATSAVPSYPHDLGNFANGLPQHILTDSLPSDMDNMSNFATNRNFFDESVLDPVSQFRAPMQTDNDINLEGINWALMSYDSLWNMESALGQYVYGDPTNTGGWEGFEF